MENKVRIELDISVNQAVFLSQVLSKNLHTMLTSGAWRELQTSPITHESENPELVEFVIELSLTYDTYSTLLDCLRHVVSHPDSSCSAATHTTLSHLLHVSEPYCEKLALMLMHLCTLGPCIRRYVSQTCVDRYNEIVSDARAAVCGVP